MKLTKKQIQHIEDYLNSKQLNYIDVRFEVFDHIVSDIEAQLQNGTDFNDAFQKVKLDWQQPLSESTSYFIGLIYQRPKLVIDKSKRIAKKIWMFLMLVFLVIPLTISFLNISDVSFSAIETPNRIFRVIATVTLFPLLFYYFFMLKDKQKTTYLFLYEKLILSFSIVNLIMLFDLFKSRDFIKSPYFAYSLLLFVAVYFGFKLYTKHKTVIKRLKAI